MTHSDSVFGLRGAAGLAGPAVVFIAGLFVAMPTASDDPPPRFAEVDRGRVLRGGYAEPEQLRWLAQRFGVQTVVSLMKDPPESARTINEQATIRELGLRFAEFPMPGNGQADFDSLDAAADAVDAALEHGPVFFHCAAGRQRSNAVTAAYRMRHGGRTFDETMAEMQRSFGFDREKDAELVAHLRRYWDERLAPGRGRPGPSTTHGAPAAQGKPAAHSPANGGAN